MAVAHHETWRVRRDRVLDLDQVAALHGVLSTWASRDDLADRRNALLFDFLLRLPLRVSEALALRKRDFAIDRPKPFVRVRRLKKRHRAKDAPPDELPVPPELIASLRARIDQLPAADSLLFWRDRAGGRAISKFDAIRAFHRLCAKAGIALPPGCAVHILRHTAATQILRRTHDLRLVQELLGHSSPALTAGYTHVAFDDAARALAGLWETEPT